MKKCIAFFLLFGIAFYYSQAQTISISAARLLPVGSTVTISGIVLNGPELGTIRYVQDGTGGIGVYSAMLSTSVKGDLVTVTGTTDDYFNLLEINPVGSWTVISSGNSLPPAALITPIQISEPYESQLIQLNNVTFSNPGGVFTGNATFNFSANTQPGIIYLRSNSPLVGTSIPAGNVTLTGICSQNNNAYQVLPRDSNDIALSGTINFTVPPTQANISVTGFDVQWQTNITGTTFVQYGNTPSLGSLLSGTGGSTSHMVSFTNASASEIFYVKAFSVSGIDTAFSDTKVFITASGSSGSIKTYFNRTVNHSVSSAPANNAVQLSSAIDDTLKAYIDRCQNTLDIAIYNFDNVNTGLISTAINDAYNRGVQIRIISDGSNNNTALSSLHANIPKLSSPTLPPFYFSIMHNKFLVIDAYASNVDLPVVWTGSTNWSSNQLNIDANNVIIFQDKSLAIAYTMEFNEMWGSAGPQPNAANEKFGPDKTDNTPHEFLIGGKRVENYFSPSDNVNYQILKTINTADAQLFFSTFVFTRYDLAFAIEDAAVNGVQVAGIFDDSTNGGGYPFSIIQSIVGNKLVLYDHTGLPGILHHKYMIVDQKNVTLDPLVLTGSHNWSNTANLKNDENTVIVHDAEIANQYYQEFYNRFTESGGIIGLSEPENVEQMGYVIFPNPAHENLCIIRHTKINSAFSITLTDITGKIISQNVISGKPGETYFEISTVAYSPGLYFLIIKEGLNTVTKKIIIN